MTRALLAGVLPMLVLTALAEGADIPPELKTPNYRMRQLTVIGFDPKLERQDPSNVVRMDGTYYVWYTQRKAGVHPYASSIYYATSKDGVHWTDQGQALGKGAEGAWDSFGVITPYVAFIGGKYYLFYTGTTATKPFKSRGENATLRHIGVAIAEGPDGPWQRFEGNPVLSPTEGAWDSVLVDDAHVIVRDGRCWFYYKGCAHDVPPGGTRWGLATADKPTGPYKKHRANPLVRGHTVCVWPHRDGIAALIDNTNTIQWSPDGIHFHRAAKVRTVHTGCGPYDPDAFTDTDYGRGITWGVAQHRRKGRLHIIRFDVDLRAPEPEK